MKKVVLVGRLDELYEDMEKSISKLTGNYVELNALLRLLWEDKIHWKQRAERAEDKLEELKRGV